MPRKDNILAYLFLHEKPVKILVGLKNSGEKSYASTLAKCADCTYAHTVKILSTLKKTGLINFEKKGRIKYVVLTDVGSSVAKDLDAFSEKIGKMKQ